MSLLINVLRPASQPLHKLDRCQPQVSKTSCTCLIEPLLDDATCNAAQLACSQCAGYPVHSAEPEATPTALAASAAAVSGPASARSAQHDKLQAVLAQARAIRGQDKPQASVTSNPQSVSHAIKTMPKKPTGTGTGAAAQSFMHDRTNRLQPHAKLSSSMSGRSSKGQPASAKPQRDETAPLKHHKPPQQHPLSTSMPDRDTTAATQTQVQQQLLQHTGSLASQSVPAESAQSHSMESQWAQTMPLQLPTYFRKAMNAFRYIHCSRQHAGKGHIACLTLLCVFHDGPQLKHAQACYDHCHV